MFQKLLFTSWALAGSVLAKSVTVCDQQTEWLGPDMTVFQEPLTDNISSYIFIDTPSQISSDNSTCECAPIFGVVANWMTNGTWAVDETSGNCTLTCDRCQVYYCTHDFQDGLLNTTNVTLSESGEPVCILPIIEEPVTTTTTSVDVPTETVIEDDITLEVEVHITNGNETANYTLSYPVPTVVVSEA